MVGTTKKKGPCSWPGWLLSQKTRSRPKFSAATRKHAHQTGNTRKLHSERDDGKVTTAWMLGSRANDAQAVHARLGLLDLCKG